MSVFDTLGTKYERGLQYTQVKPLVYENATKAIVNVSYLNSIYLSKWNDKYQNFLIGIYISQDNKDKTKQNLNNPQYVLTMNGKKYLTAMPLEKTNQLAKNIPLRNHWAKYYIVRFQNDKSAKNLKLSYTHSTFKSVNLTFEKE